MDGNLLKKTFVTFVVLATLLTGKAYGADYSYLANLFGMSPTLFSGALSALYIIALFIAYFIISPVVFLVLLKRHYEIDLESSFDLTGLKRFLELAFVLHTGAFIAGIFISLVTFTFISIPVLAIFYVIGLCIYAGILWCADRIGERFGWL